MDQTNTWTCPACGTGVRLSAELLGGSADPPDRERLDRLAHAVCGCYVLQMSAGLVGRLLASVLAAGAVDEACPPEDEAVAEFVALHRTAPAHSALELAVQQQRALVRATPLPRRRIAKRSTGGR